MFRDRLKKIMEEKGLNSAAVSSMTGIGASSISQYLSGKVNPPDKKKEQIALALGVDADYFKRGDIDDSIAADGGYRLEAEVAAKLMGVSREWLYQGLRDGRFPFGYAVKMKGSSRWTPWISRIRFTQETGIPVPVK